MKEKKLYIGLYNDYYGKLLSDRLSAVVAMYYDDDMSMGEIAKELAITPQAVKDALDRAEAKLCDYEDKLRLVEARQEIEDGLKDLLKGDIDDISREKINKLLELI